MQIVFPMGGKGTRFLIKGYTLPKPLLPIGEKKLVQLAMESVSFDPGPWHYVVSLDIATHSTLPGVFPPGCWHALVQETAGSLQTVWEAKGCLEVEEDLLICDCDSVMNPVELAEAITTFKTRGATGGVTVRRTEDPGCSYAEVDNEWWVKSTREKDVYTPWSSTGPYWFRSGQEFLVAAQRAMAAQHTSLAPVYNYLPGKTAAVPVESFRHLGTPEAYEAYKQEVEHGIAREA